MMQPRSLCSMTHCYYRRLLCLLMAASLLAGCDSLLDTADIQRGRSAVTGYGVDLSIAGVTGPASAEPWSGFDAVVTVCNTGSDTAWNVDIAVMLSTDSDITMSDNMLGSEMINELAGDSCENISVWSDVNAPDGSYVLGAIVDGYDGVSELDEANNTAAGSAFKVGHGPDLRITALAGPPSAEEWGEMTLAATVCNDGTDTATSGQIWFYLSDDADITDSDMMLTSRPLPQLDRRHCLSLTENVPSNAGQGTYYLGAIVELYGYGLELDDTNNTRVGDAIVVGNGADLTVTALTGPPSISPWQDARVAFTVCNHGTAPHSSTNLELVLSTDDEITIGPDGDEYAGHAWLPGLEPGQCLSQTTMIHPGVPDGAYYLGAIVDGGGCGGYECNPELDTTNNALAGSTIIVGNGPDLAVTSVTGPATVEPWEHFDASVTVCNHGTASSYGNHVELYVSSDSEITDTDDPVGGAPVPDLEPGYCATIPVEGHPGPTGSFHLGAIVNPYGGYQELQTSNNAAVGPMIELQAPPQP